MFLRSFCRSFRTFKLSVSEEGALRVDAAAGPCWLSRLINEDAAAVRKEADP